MILFGTKFAYLTQPEYFPMKTMKRVVDPSIKCPGHLFDSFRQIYGIIRKRLSGWWF